MDVMTAIRTRRSIRSYRDQPVEPEKLARVLEAARRAPSAKNMQAWKFVVVTDPQTRARLVPVANDQAFVGQAPVVIAACALRPDYVMPCGVPAHPVDLAIAVDHITLQAVAEGWGTCWIGAFQQEACKELLGIPPCVGETKVHGEGVEESLPTAHCLLRTRRRTPSETLPRFPARCFRGGGP